ncbi:hypothetical protein ACFQL1_01605 [Halomicroarcula sp. GCM10025709]|uniref:hypothetical protein n=1 Tax=Halomicroarcula sp. GCM10025709 TaxID=3252669 RepID=UPI00361A10B2
MVANDGTEYEESIDYSIEYQPGTITTLSSGDITDGQPLTISYEFKPVGSYQAETFSAGDRELPTQTINSVTTSREAKVAASQIVRGADSPRVTAELVLSRLDAGQSLLDDVVLDIPGEDGFEIESLTREPGRIALQCGTRAPVSEVVSDIQSQLSETADRA